MKISATPAYIGGLPDLGAPCYGEDDRYVLGELLGYLENEIGNFERGGPAFCRNGVAARKGCATGIDIPPSPTRNRASWPAIAIRNVCIRHAPRVADVG
ncbi:MAG: hypothetical protein ABR878_12100 [Roseiarcus sp.]